MGETFAIDATDLRKQYDGVDALRGLTLQVPSGSIFGFLGQNGAGKTTTIKILLGMVRPTGGRVSVFGLDATSPDASVEIRRRTGFVSDEKDLYDSLSIDELIRFTAGFYPRWRTDLVDQYVRRFDLPLTRKVKALSRGMRAKVALLLALSRGAEMLVLDEPTSGLDPGSIEEVLQALVTHVAAEGATVFFSSHQLAEVDQIADHVGIIHRGRIVLSGALDDLRESFRRVQLVFEDNAPAVSFHAPGIKGVKQKGRVVTVLSSGGAELVLQEARALNPISMDVAPVSLKEIFLETVSAED